MLLNAMYLSGFINVNSTVRSSEGNLICRNATDKKNLISSTVSKRDVAFVSTSVSEWLTCQMFLLFFKTFARKTQSTLNSTLKHWKSQRSRPNGNEIFNKGPKGQIP